MDTGHLAAGDDAGPAPAAPVPVDTPIMRQRWNRLTFLHWPFDPADVQRLLPPALQADTYDGAAWVGLVPFFMHVATPGGRQVRWASYFCETNVRTYVRDEQGRTGIWFLSLDAARLGAVITARMTYRLPYFWSSMQIAERDGQIAYRCRRRWPGPKSASSQVRVSIGDRFGTDELGERDHFLTARWILFSVSGDRHRLARAWHQPWPLYRAVAHDLDDHLVAAAGLPQPRDEPLVHYSPGVDVRIGRPEQNSGPVAR